MAEPDKDGRGAMKVSQSTAVAVLVASSALCAITPWTPARAGMFDFAANAFARQAAPHKHGSSAPSNSLPAKAADKPPIGQVIEVGFSPEGSAIALVLKVISSAQRSIHMMAYVLSNQQIVDALVLKAANGVEVGIEVDYEENLGSHANTFISQQLSRLVKAGARVCVIDAYPIFHDKVIIVDGMHVETGSFNYSAQAAKRNSENAIALWNGPDLARVYEGHYGARQSACKRFG